MKDLGYINGWKKDPEIVKKCEELGHVRKVESIGYSNDIKIFCPICDYFYRIDSSD